MSSKFLEVRFLVSNTSDGFPAQDYTSAIDSNILARSPSCIWHHLECCVNSWKYRWFWAVRCNQLMAIHRVKLLHFVWWIWIPATLPC